MIFVLGGCKARGTPKGGFGRVLARKAKKGKKFWEAASTGLTRAMFRPKIKLDVFFPARKAVGEQRK